MSISLYEISVESSKQSLGAVCKVLEKGHAFLTEKGIDPDSMLEKRLIDDMLPFSFQLNSVRHHSLGSIEGVFEGKFAPPPKLPPMSYTDYQNYIAEGLEKLSALDPATVNAALGKPVIFKAGERETPFTAENFVLSFSLPNLYFHATTTYDLLRKEGVPLSKRDYMGWLKIAK